VANPRPGDVLQLRIDTPAFGGFGVARHEGIVVFVRFAYPGESVLAKVVERKKTLLFAETVEVLEASPNRRKPPCPSYGLCGGCSCQEIDYEAQFALKVEVVEDCMRHIGKIADFPEPELIRADREFGYRNKMELSFGEDDGGIFLGQHIRGRFNKLITAERCLLMPEVGRDIATSVSEAARSAGLEAYNNYRDCGLLRHLTLRFSETDGGVIAGITARSPEIDRIRTLLEPARDRFTELVGSSMVLNERVGDTAKGEVTNLFGRSYIEEEMLGLRFQISLESFFQTNTRMARVFYSKILDFAGEAPNCVAFDLFSGTGTIAQILSRRFAMVVAIENVERAVHDARISAENNDISNVEFIFGSVEKQLAGAIGKYRPELVVLDPPRSGIAKSSLEKIIECRPKAIVYASCNPTTLARDLAMLTESYIISRAAIVDMFPQTYHIESIVRLDGKD